MRNILTTISLSKTTLLLILTFIVCADTARGNDSREHFVQDTKRINFVISVKQKKIDPAPISFQLQAKLMRLFNKDKLYVITVRNSEEMAEKITGILKEKNAMIGNIWFDSHGYYHRRKSLFKIGIDEYNYESIRDSSFTVHLKKLAVFCDSKTNIGIGSCYGGATFTLPAIENFPSARMNGDSLMISMSNLLGNASVFASESFVMTGPGILNATYALAGNPGLKKFKDPIYAPVWNRLGEWNYYSGEKGMFEERVTVSLGQDGSISFKEKKFLDFEKNRAKQIKKMLEFKRGNYNMAKLYQRMP
jgi:hypothetical protein